MPRFGLGSKSDSGCKKRKRKEKEEKIIETQKGALLKHFRLANDSDPVFNDLASNEVDTPSSVAENLPKDGSLVVEVESSAETSENTSGVLETAKKPHLDDIGLWPQSLNDEQRKFLVEKGPLRVELNEFPKNNAKRHFSKKFYFRTLPNSETVDRRWLVYSTNLDAVFCFCCRLFGPSLSMKLCSSGCDDWKHLGEILSMHESSVKHLECFRKWVEMETRLRKNQTIDRESEKLINAEKRHWHNVLERLLSIIQFLAQRNLAFRGSEEKLSNPKNGNFLGIVELISKYDPVLSEHLRRIKNDEIRDHYLGNKIQNELIQLISAKVLETICSHIRKSKYYSVILDCTSDVSRQEQMSLVIRYVSCEDNKVEIRERFICFLSVSNSTGQCLTDILLNKLKELQIPLENCRGQGYDNGANMRGKNNGVQSRILQKNPKALFVPCGCHSLNLTLGDMAKSSTVAVTFFGIVQQIYILFSASTHRWEILKKHVKSLTVKPLCETRWECKIESVKAIRFQIGDVYDAIVEVSENTNDPKCKTEAKALAKTIKCIKFLTTLCIWYDILSQFNFVSKLMQSVDINLNSALQLIENTVIYLKSFKEDGFVKSKAAAKKLADELEMDASDMQFSRETSLRRKKVKKHFDYECNDESNESVIDPEENYRINFFNVLIDQAIMSTEERFQQLKSFSHIFGFLFNVFELKTRDCDLLNHCNHIATVLDDINGQDLYTEISVFIRSIPETITSPLKILKYLYENSLYDALPNFVIALRILLTVPVTIATAERSFSKLKLVKTYLRSTMANSRLSSLALISIENDLSSSLDFSLLIDNFAAQKARKIAL